MRTHKFWFSARHSPRGTQNMEALGFTTIEIIVVLVVAGVLMVTAVPRFIDVFSSGSPLSVAYAADMIKSDIRYLQELAMSTHLNQSITFTSGSDTYLLPDSTELRDLQGVTLDNNLTVTFNPFGEPIAGGGGSLGVGGGAKTVSITNYTGKVSVQ